MDDVEIDVFHAEATEAFLERRDGIASTGKELGRDEDLVSRHSALANPLTHALLVAVGLRGVDVAIAKLERPTNRVDGFAAVLDLPDTQAEQRHHVAVGELKGRVDPHVSIYTSPRMLGRAMARYPAGPRRSESLRTHVRSTRIIGAVSVLVLTGAVVSDFTDDGFWSRHALFAGILASLIVVAVSAAVVNEVLERRQRERW